MRPPNEYRNERCIECGGRGSRRVINPAWLRWARDQAGETFRGLGAAVGLSAAYLHDIENGRRQCPDKVVSALRKLVARKEANGN